MLNKRVNSISGCADTAKASTGSQRVTITEITYQKPCSKISEQLKKKLKRLDFMKGFVRINNILFDMPVLRKK
jgi:hypothetical protein